MLERSAALAPLARSAGAHHERLDGSGYHRGAAVAQLSVGARLLAAADAYDAITHDRPYRPAHLIGEARRGYPAGLTEREAEVLRLLAQGRTNREIAEALVITEKTAGHHVEHIYGKIGVSTRVGAALFAMQHDLVE